MVGRVRSRSSDNARDPKLGETSRVSVLTITYGPICECKEPWKNHWGFRWEPPADGRQHRPTEVVMGDKKKSLKNTDPTLQRRAPSVGDKISTVEDALAHCTFESSARNDLEAMLVKLVKEYIGETA